MPENEHLRKLWGDAAEEARIGGAVTNPVKTSDSKPTAPPLLLAHTWDDSQDLMGWHINEKMDGVRAYWDGKLFRSRLGNTFHASAWFTSNLPNTSLNGELWVGRRKFQRTVSIVRRHDLPVVAAQAGPKPIESAGRYTRAVFHPSRMVAIAHYSFPPYESFRRNSTGKAQPSTRCYQLCWPTYTLREAAENCGL